MEDVLDILCIPLLGIIPESKDVLQVSNMGTPVTLNSPTSASHVRTTTQLVGSMGSRCR